MAHLNYKRRATALMPRDHFKKVHSVRRSNTKKSRHLIPSNFEYRHQSSVGTLISGLSSSNVTSLISPERLDKTRSLNQVHSGGPMSLVMSQQPDTFKSMSSSECMTVGREKAAILIQRGYRKW